jgi:hypothetical protein
MSLDRIDARFLLPRRPATAVVLGDLPHWRAGLEQANVRIVGGGDRADLAVATRARAADAAAAAAMTVVEGGRAPGNTYFGVPRAEGARLLIPLRRPAVARYALRRFDAATQAITAARNRLAAAAVGRGFAASPFVVSVGGDLRQPFVLAAGHETGALPAGAEWFLAAGQGDVLSRGAFALFPDRADRPTHVVKFARLEGYKAPFDRDERGFALVRRGGDVLEAHAPRLLARFSAEGIECSIESAAVGERLFTTLQRRGPRRERAHVIEAIAGWLLDVAVATRVRGPRPVVDRLAHAWEIPTGELALPDDLPLVVQHNDPGTWNFIVDGAEFTLLDWEDAEEHGFPLADLWYFLADALAHLDHAATAERADYFVRLFRGELASSSLLFDWTRRAVDRLQVPEASVGPLATICWLRHGSADRERREAAAELPGSRLAPLDYGELARRWLSEPGLGPRWDRWAHSRT